MESKNIAIIAIAAIIIIVAGLYASGMLTGNSSTSGNKTITILAGAGTMKAMNELKENFEDENPGVTIDIRYGGAAELFGILETQKDADLFLPGDMKYMTESMNKGYILNDTVRNVTKHIPIIAVQKGNPKNITGLADLGKSDVKVVLGDPKGPAIGPVSEKMFNKTNLTDNVTPNVVTYATTVNQLLTYLVTGQADATIIWADMTTWSEGQGKITTVEIPKDQNIIKTIPIAVTVYTKDESLAMKFEDYATSTEGLEIWKKWGFEPVNQN
ncbi:MAG TPA: molybdate ABC transporter substrate-binding protein [Methanobacterium sp.]|jgi:molybdate transport system substrate-binding protein|nr:molybdate ABC transporter substrate-binding protein [Methanobacterium sp.]HOI40537.1 molybdate ABC transporter substrate-binding protein [Methanobacterium sp.]